MEVDKSDKICPGLLKFAVLMISVLVLKAHKGRHVPLQFITIVPGQVPSTEWRVINFV